MQLLQPLSLALLVFSPALSFGQQLAASDTPHVAAPSEEQSMVSPTSRPLVAMPAPWAAEFNRWLDLREMDFSLRYRSVFDTNNAHDYNQGQQRALIDGKFKFDQEGKYGIVFHASTGKYFNWAFADFMNGGTEKANDAEYAKATPRQQAAINTFLTDQRSKQAESSGGWGFYVRRLYLDLEPVKGFELQYGSLDVNRGAASEITTYDYDGYIAGERLVIKRPQNLFFDEASITYAYIGDLYTPNFFARGDRLGQSNYHQFLVRKAVRKRLNASFDYTFQDKSHTLREAAEVKIPEARILDSARVEFYQRLNAVSFHEIQDYVPGGNGFAITVGKKNFANQRFSIEGGYAHIDQEQGILTQSELAATFCMGINGDAYGLGDRFFVRPTIKLTPYLDVNGFYTHQVGQFTLPDQILWNKQALNVGLLFDIKKAFFPKGE